MDRQGEFRDSKDGMMLCLYCEILLDEGWGCGHGGKHHRNLPSLLGSVGSGCPICIRFYKLVRKSLGDEITNSSFKEVSYDSNKAIHDSFQARLTSDNGTLSYSVIPMSGCNDVIHRDISSTTSFEQDWSLVHKWIAECDGMHRNCSLLYEDSHALPSRLLLADERSSTVQLVYCDDLHTGIKYVALSYCWGDGKIFKLTKSSHAALNSGISITELPKTYRDAIVVARQLKVQYIWIDALCIFQDSLEDWQNESSKMHDIYRNAFCCLAATGAKNPDDGLFRVRDPMRINTFIARERGSKKDFLFLNPSDWEDGITNSPLGKRGWALQERLLSRRTLHFGEQLYWECGELDANEIFPAGINTIRHAFSGPTRFKGLDPVEDGERLRLEGGERHPEWNVYRLWNRILEAYSGCSVTMKEDKLVAISGIAKYIMLHSGGDTYLAGLWHRVLPFQLLWRPAYKSPRTKSNPYRAPSWSWASLDGQIRCGTFKGDPLITIIDAAVTPLGKDSAGQIFDAYIRLDGELLMVPTNHETDKEGLGGSYELCWLDTLKQRDLALETEYYFYLPVLEAQWDIEGLILLGESVRGRYTRIGWFCLETHESDVEHRQKPAGFLEEARKSCCPSSSLWFEEGTQRTICLV